MEKFGTLVALALVQSPVSRWVDFWLKQPHPVMLVVGTFSQEEKESKTTDRLEFADVRWMEITSVLRRESENGTKPVKQIEFNGERLDLTSVREWRKKVLGQAARRTARRSLEESGDLVIG